MKQNVVKQLAVTGLAVAAVAGIAVAAAAAANSSPDTPAASSAGGPDPAAATPSGPVQRNAIPSETVATPRPPARLPAVPGGQATLAPPTSTPAPPTITRGKSHLPVMPAEPQERALPKDAVKACKELLAATAEQPGRSAKVAARLDGEPGTVLVLADSNYWAGCSTAYARHNGQGSLRRPAKLGPPTASADTFAVANNIFSVQGKEYDYYWAAGRLPAGVAKIAYTFPDGVATSAVVQGDYWLVQHREAKPYVAGSSVANRAKIKVTLQRANGSVLKEFRLAWGDQTCAQISHGC